MTINRVLKFSWGHIIAFVALIFISYVSFMGLAYLTDGNFIYAGIGVFVVDVFLFLCFIVPQILKGTDSKFSKKISYERFLVFTAPIFFVVIMVPYAHFWTIFDKRETVETVFSEAMTKTKKMFVKYEEFAQRRIEFYGDHLVNLYGDEFEDYQYQNRVEALRRQLLGENFTNLQRSAVEWVDDASEATVWNVFMIGNIKKIEAAIDSWQLSLNVFSKKVMSDEPERTKQFTSSYTSKAVMNAKNELNTLRSLYMTNTAPSWLAICSGILLYFMLLLPYMLQRRNTKSIYRLIGKEKDLQPRVLKYRKSRNKQKHNVDAYCVDDDNDNDNDNPNDSSLKNNGGNYGSFTI